LTWESPEHLRGGGHLKAGLDDALDIICYHGDRPLRRTGYYHPVFRQQSLFRETEPPAQVKNRYDTAAQVYDTEHSQRRLWQRRHGNGRDHPFDFFNGKGKAQPFDREWDYSFRKSH
jgi:hypothetical protein